MKINRHILPSGRIGLAVSGGSDSVALAFLMTKGGKKKNVAKRFVILHVDHGLRKVEGGVPVRPCACEASRRPFQRHAREGRAAEGRVA